MKFFGITMVLLFWSLLAFTKPSVNCGDYLNKGPNVKVCTDLGLIGSGGNWNCKRIKVGEFWMDEMQQGLADGTETLYPEDVCPLFTDRVELGSIEGAPIQTEYCCGG